MAETDVEKSILQSTKKLLGLDAGYTAFDLDIKTHINTAFSTLYQAGVGPVEGFFIEDENDTWDRFIGNKTHINDVKTYIMFRVKLAFDPPGNSFGLDSVKEQITELIWRLNVADDFSYLPAETPEVTPIPVGKVLIWDLTGEKPWPADAKIGDWGADLQAGMLFQKPDPNAPIPTLT